MAKGLVSQLGRFGVVGMLAFLVDYGVLMLLSQLAGVPVVLASTVAFCASVAFNYLASMRFVFTRRGDISRGREAVLFVALSLVGLAINDLVMWAGVLALGPSAPMVSLTKVAATAVVMAWNFLSRKRWLDAGAEVASE